MLEQIFDDFAKFDNCFSNGVATPLSFPSIITGYPVKSKGKLEHKAPTLAELHDGYSSAITNNPHLRTDRGYDRGFTHFIRTPGGSSETGNELFGEIKKPQGIPIS